jgi:hypothetical protein
MKIGQISINTSRVFQNKQLETSVYRICPQKLILFLNSTVLHTVEKIPVITLSLFLDILKRVKIVS